MACPYLERKIKGYVFPGPVYYCTALPDHPKLKEETLKRYCEILNYVNCKVYYQKQWSK